MSQLHQIRRGEVILVVEDHHPHVDDRPSVLLAHATGFCRQVWQPVIDELHGVCRVVTLDQRGHGDSDKPLSGYRWEEFGADLVAVVEALDLRALTAVGHSKGGAAVARLAGLCPERLRSTILLDPVLTPAMKDVAEGRSNFLAAGARRRRMVWSSRAEMLEAWRQREPFSTWDGAALQAYVDGGSRVLPDGRVELKCPGEIEAQVYEGGGSSGSLDWLDAIPVPTLLVVGGSSLALPQALAEHAATRLRDGRLLVLEGVGHFIPMERPALVASLIREAVGAAPVSGRRGGPMGAERDGLGA